MGTPQFAVAPLQFLVENGYNVVGVVTMPDKPIGRGQKMGESAVKTYAKEAGLNILQPEVLKDETFINEMQQLEVDLAIVVAFRMLPKIIWGMPRLGTFNLHTSLLPDYRGAAPINWAIINGDKKSGVTTFMLDEKIDTGDIIGSREVEISDEDNFGTLHDKLMNEGVKLVEDSVKWVANGEISLQKQSENENLRPAPKIFKEDCKIDWSLDCKSIVNLIRGLSPYPTAWTDFGGAYGEQFSMKIFGAQAEICDTQSADIGSVVTDGKKYLKIVSKDGYVELLDVQASGKKRMDVGSFVRGNKIMM